MKTWKGGSVAAGTLGFYIAGKNMYSCIASIGILQPLLDLVRPVVALVPPPISRWNRLIISQFYCVLGNGEQRYTLNMISNLKKNFIQDFFEFLPQDKNWVLIAHKIRIKIQTDIFSGRFLRAFL